LTFWRDEQWVRNALKVAGEPGLVLDHHRFDAGPCAA
jgi:hypothetical protein